MRAPLLFPLALVALSIHGQFTSMSCTSPAALQAMKGQHDPAQYAASVVIDDHEEIICALRTAVQPDSLKAALEELVSFGTRNTYSDTVSANVGIGAARRWAFDRFQQISAANEGRLVPAYLQFDYSNEPDNCGSGQGWRDVMAVLPGSSVQGHRVVIIEAHIDSRCEDTCDPDCVADGAEDNGSGTVLVLELARAMSRFTFKHTLVFLLVTGEEQGLLGSRAMAQFCVQQGIAVKGVLNNDIVGGILCGETASPPGCGVVNEVDSLQLRVFSHGSTRGMARMIELSYREKLRDHVPVPMVVSVMDREDRIGRGSDHIPFRQQGFQSVRLTAANEHGHGDPSAPDYDDRQHTSDDILGLDLDGDALLDTFFVDFNYLARNAVVNGASATLLAHGPETPTWSLLDEPAGLRVSFTGSPAYSAYRIGVRGLNAPQPFDALYRTASTSFPIPGLQPNQGYYVSVAGVDADGITSIFSPEQIRVNDAATADGPFDELPYTLQCQPIGIDEAWADNAHALLAAPNPFHGATLISWALAEGFRGAEGWLVVSDASGRELERRRVATASGAGSLDFTNRHGAGVFICTLEVGGRRLGALLLVDALP